MKKSIEDLNSVKINIIFHCPFPLDLNSKSASGIRPQKILKAFQDFGFNVDLVVGYTDERCTAIKKIKEKIKNGFKYSFVYSESSTMPTALTDPSHLPFHPFIDFNFFKFLKEKNIKIGLFYRDIHWKFDHYGIGLPWYKKQIALFFYNFDLRKYSELVDVFYLPSLEMAKYVDYIDLKKVKALPPAHDLDSLVDQVNLISPLELLYVGGVGEGYKLNYLFEALKVCQNVELTVCTRKDDWLKVADDYGQLPKNIKIVHKSGLELDELYRKSHVAVLFVEPKDYWEFAVPFKLYEYLGRAKPIIACKNTLVGNYISLNGIGWSIDYTVDSLISLLKTLDNSNIEEKLANVYIVRLGETWESRVFQVMNDLSATVD